MKIPSGYFKVVYDGLAEAKTFEELAQVSAIGYRYPNEYEKLCA